MSAHRAEHLKRANRELASLRITIEMLKQGTAEYPEDEILRRHLVRALWTRERVEAEIEEMSAALAGEIDR